MIVKNDYIDIESIEIKDVIDIDVLQTFQDKFAESMEFASIIVDKNGNPITKPTSYTSFCCDFIHSTIDGNKRCAECHKKGGEIAAITGKPYIYTCHAGLIDFAAPILVKDKLIGTILGGQVLTNVPEEEKYIQVAKEIGVDERKLLESVKKIKIITEKNLNSAAEILYLISNALSKIGYEEIELKYFSKRLEAEVDNQSSLLDESKKYNDLKTKLLITMSHELRTPINIIFCTEQLLENIYKKDSCLPEMQSLLKYLIIVKQNCYRMIRLTNNIMDMNKMELGFFNMHLISGNIIKAIKDIVLSTVDYAAQKGIDVTFKTEIEEVITTYDPEKLERIILNLLSNAIKFTQSGGKINVTIYNKNEYISLSVKDTGIGIPENMLDKIFNAFVQVDNSLTRVAEGSGIGLSIVKSLVEMHGWKISVTSKIGEGSDFRIKISKNKIKNKCNSYNQKYSLNRLMEDTNIEFSDIYL